VELDELYAELNQAAKRAALLGQCGPHRLIIERQADLALALGQPEETLRLLAGVKWPREHQRYTRGDLWKRAQAALGKTENQTPDFLGEDNLARFGAYWSD
jgi:hypothetical protein